MTSETAHGSCAGIVCVTISVGVGPAGSVSRSGMRYASRKPTTAAIRASEIHLIQRDTNEW